MDSQQLPFGQLPDTQAQWRDQPLRSEQPQLPFPEPPCRQKPQQPLWQRYRASKKVQIASVLLVFLVLVSLFLMVFYVQSKGESTAAILDKMVLQTLTDESINGWDAHSQGVFINWRRDDLSKVNCDGNHCDSRVAPTRHDTQTDLRYLENMYWYKFRHPGDTSQDQYIARILPAIKSEWGNTTLDKGWIYYLLVRLAQYSGDTAYWTNTIQHWTAAQYATLDPVLGVHHGVTDTIAGPGSVRLQDAYRVDHDLEIGAALVDAGTRFHHPEWVTAGRREVGVVIQQCFSPTFHLFNRIYLVADPRYGSHKVYDYQARMGEEGEELEALVRTGVYTRNSAYLSLAQQMLDALQSLPIHDRTDGAFYFKIYLGDFQGYSAGQVDTTMRETRQLHVLAALHLANLALGNRWAGLETEMIQSVTTPGRFFLPGPVAGFPYRLLPNFALYPCSHCSPQPTENWVTSEADGIALETIQTLLADHPGA